MLEPPVAPGGIKKSFAASVLLHAAGLALLVLLGETRRDAAAARELALRIREATPLVAPPTRREVRLEDLLEKPRVFLPPAAKSPAPPPAPPALPPPKLTPPQTAHVAPPPSALALGQPTAQPLPPAKIEPEEPPKLAFETPAGSATASPPGGPLIQRPPSSLEDAMREVAKSRGGIVVGDPDAGASLSDVSEMRGLTPSGGRSASSLELLSDPQGVDFRPYLTRILASVRRNWQAVMPESARLGRRGKVVIHFSIDREGGIPKLVIAEPSGAEPLDRAAVASITASHPFPPLPDAFGGDEVRLQFNFLYNMR